LKLRIIYSTGARFKRFRKVCWIFDETGSLLLDKLAPPHDRARLAPLKICCKSRMP
jgi:hypothetical protein